MTCIDPLVVPGPPAGSIGKMPEAPNNTPANESTRGATRARSTERNKPVCDRECSATKRDERDIQEKAEATIDELADCLPNWVVTVGVGKVQANHSENPPADPEAPADPVQIARVDEFPIRPIRRGRVLARREESSTSETALSCQLRTTSARSRARERCCGRIYPEDCRVGERPASPLSEPVEHETSQPRVTGPPPGSLFRLRGHCFGGTLFRRPDSLFANLILGPALLTVSRSASPHRSRVLGDQNAGGLLPRPARPRACGRICRLIAAGRCSGRHRQRDRPSQWPQPERTAAGTPPLFTARGRLRELRAHYGRTRYRILYQRSGNLFILLHAIAKYSGAVQTADIRIAQERFRDFKARMSRRPRVPPRAAGHDAPPRRR